MGKAKVFVAIVAITALTAMGCGRAYYNSTGRISIDKTPGKYEINGHSHDTIAAIEVTSRATINERLADACISGNANACYSFLNSYYGYGYGGAAESAFYGYYGPGGMIPSYGTSGASGAPTSGGDSDAAVRAEEKADAAMNAVKAILQKLSEEEK